MLDLLAGVERGYDGAHNLQRVLVIQRQVVGHAGDAGVNVRAAQLFGRHLLAGSSLDQRRPAQEDGACALDDHRLVAHGRHVGPAGRAGAHHGRDLGDASRAHGGLVVEDAAEVVHVGEDLVLHGQERAAGVHQIDAGQAVLQRHLLGAQVLLDRHGIVGAPLDRGVVGDDQALAARYGADAGDHARAGRVAVVQLPCGQGRQLQEGGAGVEQLVDPFPDEELALLALALLGLLAAAAAHLGQPAAQLLRQSAVMRRVGLKLGVLRVEV